MDKDVFLHNDVTHYGDALLAIEGKDNDFDSTRNPIFFVDLLEPFDLSNTARSVYDHDEFERIVRVFRRSHLTIDKSKSFSSILIEPFE